jgi:hypothetical protein
MYRGSSVNKGWRTWYGLYHSEVVSRTSFSGRVRRLWHPADLPFKGHSAVTFSEVYENCDTIIVIGHWWNVVVQYHDYVVSVGVKGKGHPRTGREGPEGESWYSSILSLTSALDEGGWSTPRPGRFTPGNDPVPIVQEAGWAPGPVWTGASD